MSDIRPEWVEAGARAIGEHRPGYGWERDDDTWRHYTQIVEWALAAVEPLIRADERERTFAHVRSGSPWSWKCLVDRDDECAWCACDCHAAKVAARLVEVICEQEADADRRVDRVILRGARMMADLRAQIAADIEAARDHFAERTGTPREHPLCRAYDDAARIARGES